MLLMSLLVSDSFLEMLSNHPNLQEVLWNFSCLKDEEKRLTLVENPHFYAELPALPEAYVDNVKIDPTDDFGHADKFYVLTDKPEPIHIMTDQVSQTFGNFWCQLLSFSKVWASCLFPPPLFLKFSDICGTLRGESIIKASLRGSHCWFCKRLLQAVSTIPTASTNYRGLQPIITEGCPSMVWKCSNGYLSLHSSVGTGFGICTGQAVPDSSSQVRCHIMVLHI